MTKTYDTEFLKNSIFLPTTEFPMRGELPTREPAILQKWQDMKLYDALRAKSVGRKPWTLHDGPPYANGNIHIGHAMNKVLKDVINRTMQMSGYDADYIPGWDCHGLPIEWKIEEKYRDEGRDKDAVPIQEFRDECREFATHWVNVQSAEFQRLGVIGNWADPYLTMTKPAEAAIAREIHKFLLNGGLYKGVKPVLWSCVEKTALAEAEVEYHEHKSVTIWVRFPVISTNFDGVKDADIVIWTTTPWTIPSNRGIATSADIEYATYTVTETVEGARAKIGDKLVVATKLANEVFEKAGITGFEQSAPFPGSALEGTICAHPWRGQGYDFDVPVLEADFVTDDAGTGFVHTAPAHGADDYQLGLKHGLEITDNIDDEGRFRDFVPMFAGLSIFNDKGEFGDGNFAPLKALEEAGALLAKGSIRHEYPHSWRSKAPLIFRATPQWFISMDKNDLRANALQAISNTKWYPAQGENRIRAMIEQRPDWCISRQRAWGVPIALFVRKSDGSVLQDENVCNRIFEIFEKEGSDAWFTRSPQDFLGNDHNAADFEQVRDIVDVWFESGSTHQFVLKARGFDVPTDMYLEGSDQHRGWFHSSLLEACGTLGHAPYKSVLTHGFVLDERGMKMSKSLGNVVAPQKLMDEYGADIVRLWIITSNYSEDIRIGNQILKTTTDMYRRIRNSLRYILGALDGFTADEAVDISDATKLPALEAYMLHELAVLDAQIKDCVSRFELGKMATLVYNFCNSELSSFYFDIRKDRLYCDRPDLFERRAYRTVMATIFEALCTWLAPVLSFTTEDAWAHRPRGVFKDEQDSVHLRDFIDVPQSWRNDALAPQWARVLEIREAVLGALELERKEKRIGSSLEAHPVIYTNNAPEGVDWAEISITSQATLSNAPAPEGAFTLNGVSVVVNLAEGNKCERCWKVLPDVGTDPQFPTLSARDADAVRYYIEHSQKAA